MPNQPKNEPKVWKNLQAIILLFIANSVSGVAQGISMIAIPWYFAKNGNAQTFGWIFTFVTALSLLWGPYSGTLIDKYNRKHIFLGLCIVCGSILFMVAGLGFYWEQLPWYMVGFIFLMTFMNYNLHYPNLYAFVQEITEKRYYGKVTSYIEVIGQLTTVMAGAGAALLLEGTLDGQLMLFGINIPVNFKIKAWTIYEIFLLDGFTYVLSFFIILLIKYSPLIKREQEEGTILKRLNVGWQYLKNNSYILLFGIASYNVFVTVLITTFYLAAKYVESHLHERGDVFASADMFYALGAILAGIAIRKIFQHTTIPMSIIIMTILTAVLFFVLSISSDLWIFYVMFLLLGITNAGIRIQRITYLFQQIPNQVFGRAGSIFFISNILFRIFFLSIFSLAFFHLDNNIIYAFSILSVFLLLSALVLIRYYKKFVF